MTEFKSTLWTVIRNAGAGRSTAVNELVARYRPAVIRFARARGLSDADAEDAAQEVFLRLFDDRVLERADPAKGRFRSLLLSVARHVLGRHFERAQASKRGGGRAPLSLDGDDALPLDEMLAREERDPDFDREWLACLLASAMRRLEREHPDYYRALSLFLEDRPHREIAAALGKTEAMVRNLVSRGRARLAQILREEVQAYASSSEEFEAELKLLAPFLEGPRDSGRK